MKIAIMGAGGIGGYLGAKLAAAGEDVTFIARGAHLAAIRDSGLQLKSPTGDIHVNPAKATDDPASVGPVDIVCFCVKLYDMASAAEQIKPMVGLGTGVISMLNGVDCVEVLVKALGASNVMGGVARISAVIDQPGLVLHKSQFASYTWGELDGAMSARAMALQQACEKAGVDGKALPNIRQDIWVKMAFLASVSGVCTLMRRPSGAVRDDPEVLALFDACVEEAIAVGNAEGAALPAETAEKTKGMMRNVPAAMKPSMLEDLERGKPLEVPWLSGAIARLGAKHGIPTPTHQFIATALKLDQPGRA